MKPARYMDRVPWAARGTRLQNGRAAAGSVLIIVLWVAFGLVSLALYFAHSMSFELRAADNRVAVVQAQHAIEGAARYVSNILSTVEALGALPDPLTYHAEAVQVGEARFWIIGRAPGEWQADYTRPMFALVDEASKLNLNTATAEMLQMLPGMTPDLAAAVVTWRSAATQTGGGADDVAYARLSPPYRCKHAPFETIEELRMVYGMTPELLFGEDINLNGVLDPNENDGDLRPPADNRDSRLDPGLLEYVTVYTREPNTGRTNVNNPEQLAQLLAARLGAQRASEIVARLGRAPGPGQAQPPRQGGQQAGAVRISSVLEFFILSGLTREEFELIANDITASDAPYTEGLVNVNTAPEQVLACIPGIGPQNAPALVAYRQSHPDKLSSVAWVVEVLGQQSALLAAPYITTRSYQFTADIAAVGRLGRGYQRVRFVFDTSEGQPKVIFRRDLTHLGWALGKDVLGNLRLATRRP
ncbi:MAG: type II secretion system protein GspK [Verrucomicrobiae bacterium]|nr:type II secretion system protein GspK [Verrucomicrobiae bacterium]